MTESSAPFVVKVGDYAMHCMNGLAGSGTLVRVESETRPGHFSIQYVSIRSGGEVSGGGGSSSWPACDFRPITDPVKLAAAKCFEAQRQAHDHKVKSAREMAAADVWSRVVQVMQECGSE